MSPTALSSFPAPKRPVSSNCPARFAEHKLVKGRQQKQQKADEKQGFQFIHNRTDFLQISSFSFKCLHPRKDMFKFEDMIHRTVLMTIMGTLFGSPQAVTLDLRNWKDYDTTYHFSL